MDQSMIHYAIVRVTPDRRRGETVNIGVAVFLPDRIDIQIIPNLHKVRALDASVDVEELRTLPEELNAITKNIDDPQASWSIVRDLGAIQLSELGWFQLDTWDQYQAKVDAILADLVTPPPAKRNRRATRLSTDFKRILRKEKLLGSSREDIERHLVVPDYPISSTGNLVADFAMRNGKWHVMETLDLRTKPETIRNEKFKQAAVSAVTLDQANELLGECIPIVIIAADDDAMELATSHLNVLGNYADAIYNFLDEEDRANCIERLKSAAGRTDLVTQ